MVRQRLFWQCRRPCWSWDRRRRKDRQPARRRRWSRPLRRWFPVATAPAIAAAPGQASATAVAPAPRRRLASPRPRAERRARRRAAAARRRISRPGQVRQSECARRLAHGRDRHHRRSGLRLRAFQPARLPARPRGRPDLRRRPVADHAARAQGAGRRMRQGDVLPDRQARDLLSGNPPAGRRRPATPSARTPGRTPTFRARRSTRPRTRSRRASAP